MLKVSHNEKRSVTRSFWAKEHSTKVPNLLKGPDLAPSDYHFLCKWRKC